jgi:predicted peptidase
MKHIEQRILIFIGLFIGVTILQGCSSDENRWIAYEESVYEITIDSETIPYAVFTPNTYEQGKETPLILALHYSGSVSDSIGVEFLRNFVEPALGNLEAIMVAPKSIDGSHWTTDSNERLVIALLDTIKANYSIHPERVLVLGYSMGATGAWHFIAHYPDLFSAAIPISGMPDPRDPPIITDQTILVIHSRDDEQFPISWVEEIVETLQLRDVPVILETVEGLGHGDIDGFIDPLSQAIPWIRLGWGLDPRK